MKREFRKCKACGKTFEFSSKDKDIDELRKTFCSYECILSGEIHSDFRPRPEHNMLDVLVWYPTNLYYGILELKKNQLVDNKEQYVKKEIEAYGNYKVLKTDCRINKSKFPPCFPPKLLEIMRQKEALGRPDFLVFNMKTGYYFFIEIKTEHDGLKYHQTRWALLHSNIDIVVVYVMNYLKNDKIREMSNANVHSLKTFLDKKK